MSYEINLSTDSDEYDKYYNEMNHRDALPAEDFHKVIFFQWSSCTTFTKRAILHGNPLDMDRKIQNAAQYTSGKMKPMSRGGSVSVDVSISWGGSEGTQGSVGISAEAHDDSGNKVEVSVEQDSNGEGSANISVSHEKDQ